jgi:aryl-alcohol dehydrogenase-like predicted oxidoreductase
MMEQRPLGRTGADVSVIGLGTWQLGGDWGDVDDDAAGDVLDAALDAGVTLLDTADVYGDGRSEERIRKALAPRGDRPFVATKAGRRADPFDAAQYTPENLRAWIDRSRRNLGVSTLDLVQLHCPPPAVYSDERVYDTLDALVEEEAIAAYGVSVETVAEGLTALQHPNVASIQVILNIFRRKPLEELLPAAARAGVGVLARVPLASGLLTGKYDESTTFPADDHRNFNRNGEAFDVGETFAGVPFDIGVAAAREVAEIAGSDVPTAAFALRWVIDQPGVTAVIPGARNVTQVRGNVAAATLAPLSDSQLSDLERLYDERIRALVHDRW